MGVWCIWCWWCSFPFSGWCDQCSSVLWFVCCTTKPFLRGPQSIFKKDNDQSHVSLLNTVFVGLGPSQSCFVLTLGDSGMMASLVPVTAYDTNQACSWLRVISVDLQPPLIRWQVQVCTSMYLLEVSWTPFSLCLCADGATSKSKSNASNKWLG